MGQLDAFSIGGEHDCVVPDDIATAKGVHADLVRRARTDVPDAAMGDIIFVRGAGFLI